MIRKHLLILSFVIILASCKTAVKLLQQDPFPPTANLTYTDFTNLYNEGYDLYIYSAEPGWNIRIDFGNKLIYSLNNGEQKEFRAESLQQPNDLTGEAFTLENGSDKITIKLFRQECNDAINAYTNPITAEVIMNNISYRGCALFTYNKKLNGYWKFQQVNGNPTSLTGSLSNRMLIDTDKHYLSAVFDCDSVSATFLAENEKCMIGTPALFPLKCRSYRTHKTLTEILRDADSYKISGDSALILKSQANEFLFLRISN